MLLPHRLPHRLAVSIAGLCAITAVAGALRIVAGGGDLWLDEVWSIQLAQQINAPWHVVTQLRSDNNHLLNTAYLACLGGDQPLWSYRLLSIVAGTLSVLVAGAIGAQRGRCEQWTAMLLTGSSYLMVHYASEARGYALAILCALSAYWCLLLYLQRRRDRFALAFAGCAALGFLSHPTFLFFYLAAGLGSCRILPASLRDWKVAIQPLAKLHLLPCGVALGLYLANFRHLHLGGGPTYEWIPLLAQTGSLAVGGPPLGIGATVAACLTLVALIGSLTVLWRQRDPSLPVLALIVALPVIAALVTHPPFLFVRYFLLAIVFAQLLFAYGLAWLFRRGRWGRSAGVALLLLFVIGNLCHVGRLCQARRGHYLAALQFIATHDADQPITIGSNHDHGTSILIDFYRQRMSSSRTITYCPVDNWPTEGPNWLILHHDPTFGPANFQNSYVVQGQTYQLAKTFDASILSGWQWLCYRKARQEAPLAAKSSREMLNVAAITAR